MMAASGARWMAVAVLAALLAGCGPRGPEFGQVSGVVRIKGKPTSRIAVRFLPDPDKGNDLAIVATGASGDDGGYALQYVDRGAEGAGAPVGWPRVTLDDMRLSGLAQGAPIPPQIIPPQYNSPSSTPLLVEVKSGDNTIDLEVP